MFIYINDSDGKLQHYINSDQIVRLERDGDKATTIYFIDRAETFDVPIETLREVLAEWLNIIR